MKQTHFYIAIASAALCLILSITAFALGISSRRLQADLVRLQAQSQNQQARINTGTTIGEQVGPRVLRDMAAASADDPAMKAVLIKHGAAGGGSPSAPTTPKNP